MYYNVKCHSRNSCLNMNSLRVHPCVHQDLYPFYSKCCRHILSKVLSKVFRSNGLLKTWGQSDLDPESYVMGVGTGGHRGHVPPPPQ